MLYGNESKRQLDKHVEQLILSSDEVKNKKSRRNLYDELSNHFNMSINVADEILTFKKDMSYFTPFELFCVMWFLDRDNLKKFFTENEITALSTEKFEKKVAKFPLVFHNMVQIADDQFIGKTTLLELMALRAGRLFNYDENEQRALKRVKFGNTEIFKPFVNKKSVDDIQAAMLDGRYVPDPITLNMPEGTDFSFSGNTLTVNSLPNGMFNLDDGFHRTLAMARIHDFNPEFDYPMELRIVNFSGSKANDFIFQQDQKNQMKKIVSYTYDTSAIPNKVIDRLNRDPGCNIQGMIGRNNAKINSAVLAKLIAYFFVDKKIKKENEMSEVIRIKTDLLSKFNLITEQDRGFLGKYSDERLFITMAVFASDISPDKYAEAIEKIEGNLTSEEIKYLNISSAGTIRKKAIDILQKEIGDV